MSDADRTPAVGDRVWRQWKGTRYEGRVVGFDYDGDPVGEFDGLTAGHDGGIGDGAWNRLCLNKLSTEWGFLDPAPAPAAPEPYVPMVGDHIVIEYEVVEEAGYYTGIKAVGADISNAFYAETTSLRSATLVSRHEKPLAVGEKVTHGRYGGVSGEIIAIKADMAWVEYPLPVGDVVLFLADLRRAPEGT